MRERERERATASEAMERTREERKPKNVCRDCESEKENEKV